MTPLRSHGAIHTLAELPDDPSEFWDREQKNLIICDECVTLSPRSSLHLVDGNPAVWEFL